jgi:hypothetical protein
MSRTRKIIVTAITAGALLGGIAAASAGTAHATAGEHGGVSYVYMHG